MSDLCDLLKDIRDAHGEPNPNDTLEEKYQKLLHWYQKSYSENRRLIDNLDELHLKNISLADSNYYLEIESRNKARVISEKTDKIKVLLKIVDQQEDKIDVLKQEKFELFSINRALEKENLELTQTLESIPHLLEEK